jgi:predicted AAA+ superfamily ATPase
VDTHRRAGDFILTGSANLLLMKHVADTLAGRAIYLDLRPFCPTEWQERKDALLPLDRLFAPDFDWREWPDEPGDWPRWLLRGGFPPVPNRLLSGTWKFRKSRACSNNPIGSGTHLEHGTGSGDGSALCC